MSATRKWRETILGLSQLPPVPEPLTFMVGLNLLSQINPETPSETPKSFEPKSFKLTAKRNIVWGKCSTIQLQPRLVCLACMCLKIYFTLHIYVCTM